MKWNFTPNKFDKYLFLSQNENNHSPVMHQWVIYAGCLRKNELLLTLTIFMRRVVNKRTFLRKPSHLFICCCWVWGISLALFDNQMKLNSVLNVLRFHKNTENAQNILKGHLNTSYTKNHHMGEFGDVLDINDPGWTWVTESQIGEKLKCQSCQNHLQSTPECSYCQPTAQYQVWCHSDNNRLVCWSS